MRFAAAPIAGAWLIDLDPMVDERGFFARTFCADEFAERGIDATVAQCNISLTRAAGTIRGLHYQVAPAAETKLVRVVGGAVHDVIVDVRPDSQTYLRHFAVELSEDNRRALFVPVGCAHGFQTLVDETYVEYQMGAKYTPGTDRGLRFDDPQLAIAWPRPIAAVSARDRGWPLIADRTDLLA
jgi:dTDP-4-dehydrorhamnose 3,5-epimerase